jgi:hypothetical protein
MRIPSLRRPLRPAFLGQRNSGKPQFVTLEGLLSSNVAFLVRP